MSSWNRNCKYAPTKEIAAHCKKENQGERSEKKASHRGRPVGKGNFGCARHCRFFSPKEAKA